MIILTLHFERMIILTLSDGSIFSKLSISTDKLILSIDIRQDIVILPRSI